MKAAAPSKAPEFVGGPFCGTPIQLPKGDAPPQVLRAIDDDEMEHRYYYVTREGIYKHQSFFHGGTPPKAT